MMYKAALAALMLCIMLPISALVGHGDTGSLWLDNVPPTLSLLSPTGGESWYFGDVRSILWQAADTHIAPSPVAIYYTLDGVVWHDLAVNTANDGQEIWNIPATNSSTAQVKISVRDAFGNTSHRYSGIFQIIAAPPADPQGVNVQILNGEDAYITWLPVTQTVQGIPVTPDGYIVLFSEHPEWGESAYFFLGETSQCSFTHFRVALFRPVMHYRVLAYVARGDRGAMLAPALGKGSIPYPGNKNIRVVRDLRGGR